MCIVTVHIESSLKNANLSSEEKILRKKNLELFYLNGFPSKKDEDWKFTKTQNKTPK